MAGKQKGQKKLFLYGGCVLALLALIAGFVVVHHSNASFAQAEQMVSDRVETLMLSETGEIDLLFQKTSIAGFTSVASLGSNGYYGKSATTTLLTNINKTCNAYLSMYCTTDGTAFDQNGNVHQLPEDAYSGALSSSAFYFSYVKDDLVTGSDAIVYFAPVTKSGELYAHLIIYLDPRIISKANKDADFGKAYFYVMADGAQNALFHGGTRTDEKLLSGDFFENGAVYADTSYSWANFNRNIRSRTSTSTIVKTEGGEYILYAQPLESAGWTVIYGVPHAYYQNKIEAVSEPYRRMKVELILIFVGAMVLYVAVYIISSNVSKKQHKNLENKADTDQLTGLTNKLATERIIKEYIETHPNGGGVMVLIDVDNFKKINDTMGHAFGDEVLRQLGLRLRTLYRVTDVVGRIGGDEFMVFLKDVKDPAIMKREAGKIITFFAGFQVGEYVKYSVTGSLGAAIFPVDAADFDSMYKRADAALYKSKKNGKNRLTFYDELDGQNDEEKE